MSAEKIARGRLRLQRLVDKSSQNEVARKLGTSQQNVQRWCAGLRPDANSIALMTVLGIQPNEWFEFVDVRATGTDGG